MQRGARGGIHFLRRDFRQLVGKADCDRVGSRCRPDERLDLLRHLFHDKLRRDDVLAFAILHAIDDLVECARNFANACDVVLGISGVIHLLDLGKQVGYFALHAEQLVDGVIMKTPRRAVDDVLQEMQQDLVGKAILPFGLSHLPIGVVALQRCQVIREPGLHFVVVRQRTVAKFGVVTANADRLEHAKLGEQFRVVQHNLQEHAVIEPAYR